MEVKGVIFDLDGTLLDSMSVWDHVGRDFLGRHGRVAPSDLNDTVKRMSLAQSSAYFIKEYGLPLTVEEVMAEMYAVVAHAYHEQVPLKPYVLPYLQKLGRENIPYCVATATDRRLALGALERLGVADSFRFILTCDELGVGKDDPAIFATAAARLGVKKEEVLVFEDSLHAVETAAGAGYPVVGVFDEKAKKDEARIRALCKRYIHSFKELL